MLAAAGTALTVGLAGCGSDDGTTAAGGDGTEDGTDGEGTESGMDGGGVAQTVAVGDGGLNFSPESFTVSVGDTVEWSWAAGGHNVVPDEIPDGSDWSGSEGAPSETLDEGATHRHTFETAGEYSYYCNPHQGAGMTGSFTVEES